MPHSPLWELNQSIQRDWVSGWIFLQILRVNSCTWRRNSESGNVIWPVFLIKSVLKVPRLELRSQLTLVDIFPFDLTIPRHGYYFYYLSCSILYVQKDNIILACNIPITAELPECIQLIEKRFEYATSARHELAHDLFLSVLSVSLDPTVAWQLTSWHDWFVWMSKSDLHQRDLQSSNWP